MTLRVDNLFFLLLSDLLFLGGIIDTCEEINDRSSDLVAYAFPRVETHFSLEELDF